MPFTMVTSGTVTNRAKRLLESFLSEEQMKEAKEYGMFHEPLPGGLPELMRPVFRHGFLFDMNTGHTYAAGPKQAGSYYPFGTDKWQAVQHICLVPSRTGDYPDGKGYAYDMILAVLLAVRTDTVRFFKHVNSCGIYHGDRPCPNGQYGDSHPGY